MFNKAKVYIASPYTIGDVAINVQKAISTGEVLAQLGFTPYIPVLTHLWHLLYSHDPAFWYHYDNEWLSVCDCLLRLPGESKGADDEVILAKGLNKPVFYDIKELTKYYGDNY